MPFELAFSKSFMTDFMKLHQHVQKKLVAEGFEQMTTAPHTPRGDVIKKLEGFRDLWRYRTGDYRVVYFARGQAVVLLMAGHRKDIYDRLRYDPDKKKLSPIVAVVRPELLPDKPQPEDVLEGTRDLVAEEKSISTPDDRPLPFALDEKILAAWGVPGDHWPALCACATDNQLEGATIPDDIKQQVLDCLWPPHIEEVLNRPVLAVDKPQDLIDAAAGTKPLSSFLLRLDDAQLQFVKRYGKGEKAGPWIVKGGPGTGKSMLALYCIRDIINNPGLGPNQPSRILLTTYTNSLTAAARQLLGVIAGPVQPGAYDVRTVASQALKVFGQNMGRNVTILEENERHRILEEAIRNSHQDKNGAFGPQDTQFLDAEIKWVIQGNSIATLDTYQAFKRHGRGRPLGANQKANAWLIYAAFKTGLGNANLFTHEEIACEALRLIKTGVCNPHHDYVFIDEAQDLTPVAIQFCIALCQSPQNVFLTADTNQSIYSRGVSWASIDDTLRGARHETLRTCYRSTQQIIHAVNDILSGIDDADKEALPPHSPYKGPVPVIRYTSSLADKTEAISQFILTSLKELNLGPGCAAVLCPTNDMARGMAADLPPRLRARFMSSRGREGLDLDYCGVKVLTMHSAKGLEFPVVAVTGLTNGILPFNHGGPDGAEEDAKGRNLFFVACSRAMRRLMVTADGQNPSSFLQNLSEENWDRQDPEAE